MAKFGFGQRDRIGLGPVQDEFDELYARLQQSPAGDGVLEVEHGGTGLSSWTQGDLISFSDSTTMVPVEAVVVGNVLISAGVETEPMWGKVDLTLHVSGVLPVDNGGTGLSTYATGDILYADGATSLARRAIGTSGQVLTVSGGVPAWQDNAVSDGYYEPLTDGDTTQPELIFDSRGDVIMVWHPGLGGSPTIIGGFDSGFSSGFEVT